MFDLCFTPEQCAAGRALLGMTRKELSDESGVKLAFIRKFETRKLASWSKAVVPAKDLMITLIEQGCVFTNRSGVALKDVEGPIIVTELERRHACGEPFTKKHVGPVDIARVSSSASSRSGFPTTRSPALPILIWNCPTAKRLRRCA